MTTEYDVWQYLKTTAEAQGLKFDSRSGLLNNRRTADLIRSVQYILKESGYECGLDAVQKVLELRVPNLVSSWTGVDTEAHRAVDKFFKINPEGLNHDRGKGDDAQDNNHDGEDGHGQGEGNGEDQGEEFRQGQGDGDGNGDGDGDGDGDGEDDDDDWDLEKDQKQGRGDGGWGDGDGERKKGDDRQEEDDDTPQPQDPNYIKPKVWNAFMRILMWNMEHPGKQKNIMLVGPRGIGKTEMVIQAAKALHEVYPEMAELPFMITSPQMKHEVTGYGNAMGEAVLTEFTKGYVAPGITLIEEMDRSEPTALIAMNAAMANKIMDTPVIGMIRQNPLCTIVATANTAGVGATEEYVTANQLDASTRDRFIYLSMEFDAELAVQIARGDKHLVAFIEKWNEACEMCGLIQNTCSYRALTDIKDLRDMGFTVREALENVVLKACVPKDNLRSVLDKMKDLSMNPYFSAMELIEASMPAIMW